MYKLHTSTYVYLGSQYSPCHVIFPFAIISLKYPATAPSVVSSPAAPFRICLEIITYAGLGLFLSDNTEGTYSGTISNRPGEEAVERFIEADTPADKG